MAWFWQTPSPLPEEERPDTTPASLKPRADLTGERSQSSASTSFHLNFTTLLSTACLTSCLLGGAFFYSTYLTRIPTLAHLPASLLRHPRRTLLGRVVSVGDADNFRLYHTPGGILAGWGWLRQVPAEKKALTNQTLHVRIAGIDAPELAHFGSPGQPGGKEALAWLTQRLDGRSVRVHALRRDQYDRLVGTVAARGGWRVTRSADVGREMIRAGWATVYEAKRGAEYDGREEDYREAERLAKKEAKGIWGGAGEEASVFSRIGAVIGLTDREPSTAKVETPRQFKTRMTKVNDRKTKSP